MGCVSSKLMSTSVSFQEEVKQKRSSPNIIHQELTISADINNHFPSVPTPNNFGSGSVSLMHILLNNKPSKEVQGGQVLPRTSRIKPSTSCASPPENQKLGKNGTEETRDCMGKSIHTVEEYDVMKQPISRLESDTTSLANNTIDRVEKRHTDLNDTSKDSSEPGKGSRRKFISRSLESLEIPRSIEFPIVGPEAYVTPKFGYYSLPTANKEVFDPQLVADFEQCMQQLEEETQASLQQFSDQNHAKEDDMSHAEP